jgi:hypothetical protein
MASKRIFSTQRQIAVRFFKNAAPPTDPPSLGSFFQNLIFAGHGPAKFAPSSLPLRKIGFEAVYPPQNWVRFFKSPPAVDSAPNRRKDP